MLVVVLAIMIVLEFSTDTHQFEPWWGYLDLVIVGFFVLDLFFKWRHVRKVMKFVRLYWLEILAVFPFYLLIRAYTTLAEIIALGKGVSEAQEIAHEAVLLRETKILRETELIGKEARLAREAELVGKEARFVPRIVRFVQRLVRFVWGSLHLMKDHLLHVSRRQQK